MESKIIAHPQEKSGKSTDSWAKKIYEDNHGAFHILMAVVKRIWYLLQM